MNEITIKGLFIFPVKSLRGFEVENTHMSQLGFDYDRHWMIINKQGTFISQRKYPSMVLIQTELSDNLLHLRKPGMPELQIPLIYQAQKLKVFTAKVWRDECQVIDEGESASGWLSEALNTDEKFRLVRMAPNTQRPQSKPELLGKKTHTLFADAAPFLICNHNSLTALNEQLNHNDLPTVTMERFRPNIVVDGLVAFTEHSINTFNHSQYQFQCRYPCQRCVIPTIDIDSGKRHPQQQPYRLLSEMNPMPSQPKAPAFGENAILSSVNKPFISVGDILTISNN